MANRSLLSRCPSYINEVLLCLFVHRKISTLTFETHHIYYVMHGVLLKMPTIHISALMQCLFKFKYSAHCYGHLILVLTC